MIALVAIALSAGAALAARPATTPPDAAADGLDRATEVSGRTVPAEVIHPEVPARPTEAPEELASEEPAETAETSEVDEPDRPMNHGWYVSEAAKAETPAGYDSHGAYVSSIAKGDAGKPSGSTGAGTSRGGTKAVEGQAKAAEARAAASERKGAGNGSDD
jgi:hypothetical protein